MFIQIPMQVILTLLIGAVGWFVVYRHRRHAERYVHELCQQDLLATLRFHNPTLKESTTYHVIWGSLHTRIRMPLPLSLTPKREAVIDSLALGLLCAVSIELREPFLILDTLAEYVRQEHNVSTSVFVNDKGAMELVIREPSYQLYYFVFDSKDILI